MKCGTTYRKCPSKQYYTYYTQARRDAPSIDSSWFSVNPVKLPNRELYRIVATVSNRAAPAVTGPSLLGIRLFTLEPVVFND